MICIDLCARVCVPVWGNRFLRRRMSAVCLERREGRGGRGVVSERGGRGWRDTATSRAQTRPNAWCSSLLLTSA